MCWQDQLKEFSSVFTIISSTEKHFVGASAHLQVLYLVLREFGEAVHLLRVNWTLGYQKLPVLANANKAFSGRTVKPHSILCNPEMDHEKGQRKLKGCVSFRGTTISNLLYADDTALVADDEIEMVEFLRHVEKVSIKSGL